MKSAKMVAEKEKIKENNNFWATTYQLKEITLI